MKLNRHVHVPKWEIKSLNHWKAYELGLDFSQALSKPSSIELSATTSVSERKRSGSGGVAGTEPQIELLIEICF